MDSDNALILTQAEARVLGCLVEKAALTPETYPLTLNAAVVACNQKTSREPVLELDPGNVGHALRTLEDKGLVKVAHGSRALRYEHRMDEGLRVTPEQRAEVEGQVTGRPQAAHEQRLHRAAEEVQGHHVEEQVAGIGVDQSVAQQAPVLAAPCDRGGPKDQLLDQRRAPEGDEGHHAGQGDDREGEGHGCRGDGGSASLAHRAHQASFAGFLRASGVIRGPPARIGRHSPPVGAHLMRDRGLAVCGRA